jgi:YidC/Oxa1 family membrane protein insertase
MDIQRYLLIGASAALTVMLLGEWRAFKQERTDASADQRVSIAETTPYTERTLADDTNELLSPISPNEANATVNLAETDLPSVETPPTVTTTDAIDAGQNRYVTVRTPTLHAVIDLNGGDIIEVGLPQYPEALDQPDTPFILLEQNQTRTYIAQSGIVGPDGIDTPKRARYIADQKVYAQNGEEPLVVELQLADGAQGISVTKRYTFAPDSYVINLDYDIKNQSTQRWQGVPFVQLKRDNTPPPNADSSGMGMQPFLGVAMTTPDERFIKHAFDDLEDDPVKVQNQGGWIAMMQHYFVAAWIPNPNQTHQYSARRTQRGDNIAGLTSPAITIDPGLQQSASFQLYVGPKDQYSLETISPHLDLTVDYGWLWWIAQPLFWLLTKIHGFVQNWGVAIILLTVLVKAAFFRLSATGYRSMARMRKVQPKMQAIKEQYADDKQKQSHEMMDLYKKEKINPMGGCFPILIQMPVFIALYWVLMESVELRQAPFALWIHDLSVMDPYFVLPIMMGASMYFMQKLNPPPPDPMQAKIMQWLPIVFTFFFLWFPAGLVLYWVVNNLLSMAQQYVITRAIEKDGLKTGH